ncbi:S-formylglutathione hydrolase FrmB [Algoriphagus boseongensis]|uniref:S-formylglutathione hydrolase FrmB n=1 Tax=Algoriphagus boseongensis TaxID=1442587 RepID=A0A4V3D2C8_9BACT|nr:alpha/beta hydrolase family protein [Algoriphagus boseongensis]TDQ18447.1 S-formylglutathione hydrolase FrmB [Algoriphagus boseongensis]
MSANILSKKLIENYLSMRRSRIVKTIILLLFLSIPLLSIGQAKVDSIEVYSPTMKKNLRAAVTLPSSYSNSDKKFAVIYLLHGGSGSFSDWHQKVTQKGLVNQLAEQYDLIIVTPSVGPASYYYDSPKMDSVKYETYFINELIPHIDRNYRTLAQKESRAITGLSMGGHGSLMLSAKHPELFSAAGSMSGVMNIDTRMWEVPEDFRKLRADGQKEMLGENLNYDGPAFNPFTVVGLVNQMKANGLALIIDCGVDDFLIDTNRQMHQLLLENGTPHEYTERPGAHTWQYWTDALPVHFHFLNKYLKRN